MTTRTRTLTLAWTGAAAIGVAFGFGRYGYGLFLPEIRAAYGLDLATAGLFAGLAYGAYVLAVLAAGVLAARVGPRVPVLLGIGTAVAGVALVAAAHHRLLLAVGLALAGTSPGLVWAPYSDLIQCGVDGAQRRERTLAVVGTGTCLGLVVAAPLALLAGSGGWRLAWAGFALVGLVVALVAVRVLPASSGGTSFRLGELPAARMVGLVAFSVTFSGLGAVYFTYVVDIARRAGLPFEYGPLVYVALGVAGFVGLATGHLVERHGLLAVSAGGLLGMVLAGVLLLVATGIVAAVLVSAAAFGAAFMVSAALLAIIAARVSPSRPSASLTVGMLAGAAAATVAPPLFAGLPIA